MTARTTYTHTMTAPEPPADAEHRATVYQDGKEAYKAGTPALGNPHIPAPPGDLDDARAWRAGWHVERRRDTH
ncbi:Uncharacterised protein [Mycobacteroides abscessus subsp. abscessus]|nr:Uncharacterised protein [Mycobacteroides abscessus subsp. abscessus]SLC89405.1 Uncharacterised protein [Mycobacteroides abscessus subsp. abscessus]